MVADPATLTAAGKGMALPTRAAQIHPGSSHWVAGKLALPNGWQFSSDSIQQAQTGNNRGWCVVRPCATFPEAAINTTRLLPSTSCWQQGNRARLEKVMMKLITGQPVSIVLLGGSISIRGWNHPDEAYIRQVRTHQQHDDHSARTGLLMSVGHRALCCLLSVLHEGICHSDPDDFQPLLDAPCRSTSG